MTFGATQLSETARRYTAPRAIPRRLPGGASMRKSASEEVQKEILDLLQMGPETATSLATMLDEETESLILSSHSSLLEGIVIAVRNLQDDGMIQCSTRFPAMWELTPFGRSIARTRGAVQDDL
ncbi:hypothetical protein [Pseudonocardia sp. NPDC049635]|uniref:hypothetical protein n=1 Tax=Pseudonocardia sp. NPDC049635 TaxID=3155506 RepID=UPI0033C9E362